MTAVAGSRLCMLLTFVVAVGCKHAVELYCDEDTPCLERYPERPFCDLSGDYPASEGIGRTCIPCPFEGVPAELCEADSAPPVVEATSPVQSADDVQPTTLVQAVFSDNMDASSINETSFVVALDGAPIAGTVTYDAATRTATFTPADRMRMLGTYGATIGTTVSDLRGNRMQAEHVWAFTVRDGTWLDPADIGIATAAHGPNAAIDWDGRALVIWQREEGGITSIWGNRYENGVWDSQARIDRVNQDAAYPELSINPLGRAVAVWAQSDAVRYNAWASTFDPTNGWATATLLEEDDNDVSTVAVGIDDDGDAVATWTQTNATAYNVKSSHYVADSSWSDSVPVESGSTNAVALDMACALDGSAIAVWYQSDGAVDNLWGSHFVEGSGWDGAVMIENDDQGDVSGPRVSLDLEGNGVAVWAQDDGARTNVWASRYDTDSSWSTPVLLETTSGSADNLEVAVAPSGDAVAIFRQYDGLRNRLYATRYLEGIGWEGSVPISNDGQIAGGAQAVAVDSVGNAIAVWLESDGIRTNVWASRGPVGSGWSTPVLIETDNAGNTSDPDISVNSAGVAIATWVIADGPTSRVVASVFE